MKNFIPAILLASIPSFAFSADFRSGETVVIDTSSRDDIYAAGEYVALEAPLYGDMVSAGRKISIADTVAEDAILAAENIVVSGFAGDDIRAFGRSFNLSGTVMGDLVLFSAEALIGQNAVIEGDLIIFSGDVTINGLIKGKLLVKGGNVTLNGTVMGPVSVTAGDVVLNNTLMSPGVITAGSIRIREDFKPQQPLRYWQEAGRFRTEPENMVWDPSLAEEFEAYQEDDGVFTAAFFWQVLAGLLSLLILHILFRETFRKAGGNLLTEPGQSIGFGFLYILAMPLACIVLLITLIGIPIGLAFLALYIFTLIFALAIVSLAVAYFLERKQGKTFSFWAATGIAAGIYLLIKFLLLIPYVAVLFWLILAASGLGALITAFGRRRKMQGA